MQIFSINQRVENIKENEIEINKFVEEYKPFIASSVEKVIGRYVKYGEDDELSIALIAFVEAIKAFDSSKGSFLSFAQNVIKRRLIDYFRKEKRNGNVISLNDYMTADDEYEKDLTQVESIARHSDKEINDIRKEEIEELKKELERWDITFLDLSEASPKHEKTRKLSKEIVNFLFSQRELLYIIKNKKYLPIAEIEKFTGIPRKKIERLRKYIIAVVIVLMGDYQYIQEYVNWKD